MPSAKSVLDRMIKAMNRGEPVRANFYDDLKGDVDVFAKPKRKKGRSVKKPSTTKTFRKPVRKRPSVRKKSRR